MTLLEFSDQFDILFDSIAGKSAPGFDAYEKSVYLTKAQLEIVKNHYDPTSNAKQKGFENTEKRRVDIKELVKTHKTKTTVRGEGISELSSFVVIPNDTFLIVFEKVVVSREDCPDKSVMVIPTTHDEFNYHMQNPFKRASKDRAMRLDVSSMDGVKVVEIVYPIKDFTYINRYIKYPNPIILKDLNIEFPNDNLTLDSQSAQSECELDQELHPEILNRAVQLAVADYKTSELEAKIATGARDE